MLEKKYNFMCVAGGFTATYVPMTELGKYKPGTYDIEEICTFSKRAQETPFDEFCKERNLDPNELDALNEWSKVIMAPIASKFNTDEQIQTT